MWRMEKSMETKIMMSTEKNINNELERGRKATIKIAVLMDKCEKNWEETDEFKNARDFIKETFSFSNATVSNYIGCVNMFDLTNPNSDWANWNLGQLTELLRLKDLSLALDLVDRGCIDETTSAKEIREYVKDINKRLLDMQEDDIQEENVQEEDEPEEDEPEEVQEEKTQKEHDDALGIVRFICLKYLMTADDIDTILKVTGLS